MNPTIKIDNYPVYQIVNQKSLEEAAKNIARAKIIFFDTEFDRFRRKFGFTLLLLQIFDGKSIYLIEVKKVKILKAIWDIFENSTIKKVVYSGKEDVQLLKLNKCFPKNLFDIQVASNMLNFKAKSFGGLVKEILSIELDKSQQKSDWNNTTLTSSQLLYAAKDVAYLMDIYNVLFDLVEKNQFLHYIEEENQILQEIELPEFSPQISTEQKKMFNKKGQEIILEIFKIFWNLGKKLNRPPSGLITPCGLNEIINAGESFRSVLEINGVSWFIKKGIKKNQFVNPDEAIKKVLSLYFPSSESIFNEKGEPKNSINKTKDAIFKETISGLKIDYKLFLEKKFGSHAQEFFSINIESFLKTQNQKKYPEYKVKILLDFLSTKGYSLEKIKVLFKKE